MGTHTLPTDRKNNQELDNEPSSPQAYPPPIPPSLIHTNKKKPHEQFVPPNPDPLNPQQFDGMILNLAAAAQRNYNTSVMNTAAIPSSYLPLPPHTRDDSVVSGEEEPEVVGRGEVLGPDGKSTLGEQEVVVDGVEKKHKKCVTVEVGRGGGD